MKFEHPVTLEELAKLTGSRVIGSSASLVSGIKEIHMEGEGDIT